VHNIAIITAIIAVGDITDSTQSAGDVIMSLLL